jgi:hypothetical protein
MICPDRLGTNSRKLREMHVAFDFCARIYLAIARDGLLPAALTAVTADGGSPWVAQIFCGSLAALLATFFDVDKLAEILSIGIMAAYAVVCAAVIVLRFSDPQGPVAGEYSSIGGIGGGPGSARASAAAKSSLTSLKDELHPRPAAAQSPAGGGGYDYDRTSGGGIQSIEGGCCCSQSVTLQASFASLGLAIAGALAAAATTSSASSSSTGSEAGEAGPVDRGRVVLGAVSAVLGVGCVIWLQWLFYEHPAASERLDEGFSCPLVRWVPLAGECLLLLLPTRIESIL